MKAKNLNRLTYASLTLNQITIKKNKMFLLLNIMQTADPMLELSTPYFLLL